MARRKKKNRNAIHEEMAITSEELLQEDRLSEIVGEFEESAVEEPRKAKRPQRFADFFGEREVAPLHDSEIQYERFRVRAGEKCKYPDCSVLCTLENKTIGILPRIPMSKVWELAELGTNKKAASTFGITQSEWEEISSALQDLVWNKRLKTSSYEAPVLVQDVWHIPEIDFVELFFEKGTQAVKLIKTAVNAEIEESANVASRWKKIKHYLHKVPLERNMGGIFSDRDAAILRTKGIRYLNDIKKKNIYFLKNLFLERDLSRLPEAINAAFKEDLERRKDFRFQFWPFFFGISSLIAMAVIAFIFEYTLLKNTEMTYTIYGLLALWVAMIAVIIWGAKRAVRRRRTKRTNYFYFTSRVKKALTVFILCSLGSLTAVTVYYERYDGYDDIYYYRNLGNEEISIAGLFDPDVGTLEIPTSIDGKTVTAISGNAFWKSDVTSVTVPDSVVRIRKGAFKNCERLESVSLPEYLEEISAQLFKGTKALDYLEIPEGVKFIDDEAFAGSGIIEVSLPTTLNGIGDGAFQNCTFLTSIEIPAAISHIGKRAFSGCENVTDIQAEDNGNILEIPEYAFENCRSLVSTNLSVQAEIIGKGAFKGCASLTECEITNAKEIGQNVFKNCSSLTDLSVPFIGKTGENPKKYTYLFNVDSVRNISVTNASQISKKAFAGLTELRTVYLTGSEIGEGAFSGCVNLETVYLPDEIHEIKAQTFDQCQSLYVLTQTSIISVGKEAFNGCTSFADSSLLINLSSIGEAAFSGTGLKSADLSKVSSIGDRAFEYCSQLTDVILSADVEVIGNYAFGNTAVTEIDLSQLAQTRFGSYLFHNCSSLVSIGLPAGITVIPEGIVSGCSGLATFSIGESVTSIGAYALSGTALTGIAIPASVTEIGEGSFSNSSLVYVTIPDSVQKIGKKIFENCYDLISLTTPFLGASRTKSSNGYKYFFGGLSQKIDLTVTDMETIESTTFGGGEMVLSSIVLEKTTVIKKNAFKKFIALNYVGLNEGLTTLEDGAFRRCTSLQTIVLPDSLKKIGADTFRECAKLQYVTLGDGVESIGSRAFRDCTSLESIAMGNGLKKLGSDAFYRCTKLYDISLNNGLEEIGSNAFNRCTALTDIVIPSTVQKIGSGILKNCTSLESITTPFIGPKQKSAKKLTHLTNKKTVTSVEITNATKIAQKAFNGFYAVQTLKLNDGIQEIGEDAFLSCYDSLRTVYLPISLSLYSSMFSSVTTEIIYLR